MVHFGKYAPKVRSSIRKNLGLAYKKTKYIQSVKSLLVTVVFLCWVPPRAIGQEAVRGTILTLTERGAQQDSVRVGVWEYYDHPRHVNLKVDYDKGRITYVRPDTGSFYVLDGDNWVRRRLPVPCRYNGSITTLIEHYDHFTVPEELSKHQRYFSTWLTFRVGPEGATNPEVHDDPGYGVKEQILTLFELAPNTWLTGVDEFSKVVTCLMAIRFDYCITCDQNPNFPARILFTGINPRKPGPRSSNAPMISFSPDNSKLTVLPITVGLQTTTERTIIVDLKSKEIRELPFDHYGGVLWLNNDEILFMPKYFSRIPSVLAKLQLSTNRITFLSDSTTSQHTLSPDRQRLAFLVPHKRQQSLSSLYVVDLVSGAKKMLRELPIGTMLQRWSPDGSSIITQRVEETFLKNSLISTETGGLTPLPIMDASVFGWSSDGNIIYQYRNSKEEWKGSREVESPLSTGYSGIVYVQTVSTTQSAPVTELLETNLTTNAPRSIMKKTKAIRFKHSTAKDMFLLLMDNGAYLKDAKIDSKPMKIIDNCDAVEWSPDGAYIAYISSRDHQLHLYTVATGQSEYLTLPVPVSKKKKVR